MSPVSEALADGVSAEVLAVAAHEVAHGLAWRAAGFAPGPMYLEYGLFGGLTGAGCAHNADGLLDASNIEGFLIGLMAGAAGQARCAARHLRGSHARDGDDHDRSEFDYLQRHYRTGLSQDAARRRAEKILDREGAHLDTLTVRLARTGRLSGGDL